MIFSDKEIKKHIQNTNTPLLEPFSEEFPENKLFAYFIIIVALLVCILLIRAESEHREILSGHYYRHFKGNIYQVIGIATHTETEEKMVVIPPERSPAHESSN